MGACGNAAAQGLAWHHRPSAPPSGGTTARRHQRPGGSKGQRKACTTIGTVPPTQPAELL